MTGFGRHFRADPRRWLCRIAILAILAVLGADVTLAQGSRTLSGSFKKSMEDARKMAAECQKKPTCRHYKKGRGLYNSKRYREAIAEFDTVIRHDRSYAVAYVMRGMALTKIGKARKALAQFDAAIAAARKKGKRGKSWYWWPYYHKGWALMRLRDAPAARAAFSSSLRSNPTVRAYEARARTYAVEKKYRRSSADIDKAIGLDPKRAMLWTRRSKLDFMARNPKRGCRAARRACALGDCQLLQQVPKCKR